MPNSPFTSINVIDSEIDLDSVPQIDKNNGFGWAEILPLK